jgi:PAS domain S-box-containing protein
MKKRNATGKQTPRKFDLTDRREVEERLRRSEERYRRIFENIQDIYYEVGLDGTILEISPSIESYSPFRREELIGRSINEFYADQTQRNSFLQAIMERGSVHDFEIQLRDSGGSLFTCSITAAILPVSEELPPHASRPNRRSKAFSPGSRPKGSRSARSCWKADRRRGLSTTPGIAPWF